GATDRLPDFARLLGQRPHLVLHILAVEPHDLGDILGGEQLLRIIERRLHVLFGETYRLGADILGVRPHRRVLALDRAGRLLGGVDERLKRLARLIEARFRHRPQILWYFEAFPFALSHLATPVVAAGGPD